MINAPKFIVKHDCIANQIEIQVNERLYRLEIDTSFTNYIRYVCMESNFTFFIQHCKIFIKISDINELLEVKFDADTKMFFVEHKEQIFQIDFIEKAIVHNDNFQPKHSISQTVVFTTFLEQQINAIPTTQQSKDITISF